MKKTTNALKFFLAIMAVVWTSGLCAQTADTAVRRTEKRFEFQKKMSARSVKEDMQKALGNIPQGSEQKQQVPVKAYPLDKASVQVLSDLLGNKNVDITYLAKNQLTAERITGLFFSAQLISRYIELEKEYNTRLSKANTTTEKESVSQQWAQINAEFLEKFAGAGLPVTKNDLSNWSKNIIAKRLNERLKKVTRPSSKKSQAMPANTSIAVKRVLVWKPFVKQKIFDTVLNTDFCTTPLATNSYKLSYRIPYEFTIEGLPDLCREWACLTSCDWCETFVTPFSVFIEVSVDVGYRITCCGGTAWASAIAKVCGEIVGIGDCLSCNAGGVAVIGAGTAGGERCVYGLGITLSFDCQVFGIHLVELNYPVVGFTITAACPPPGFNCQ